MAEQIARDVVKEAQSMGNALPIDETAKPTNTTSADDGTPSTAKNLPATEHPNALSTESGLNGTTGDISNAVADVLPNGTSDQLATDDVLLQSAVADVSGGSDTDTSRDLTKESGRGHARTGSVKKPTFFKSSSVTKTFLAKAASTTPPVPGTKAATPSSQGTSPSLQTAKPRLVAKSGSGLGNIPRSGLSKANGASGGPDASKVWNKNRPVPPQPQKQFTDEELKQQYGIHMATRLQADDPGKDQSKWADIDDDEEDWAPETVEWMDGTKSTVAVVENAPPVEEVKVAPPPKPTAPVEIVPARSPAPVVVTPAPAVQGPNSTSGSKTILKPGVSTPATQSKPGSLVLKGGPEKPALVSKSPAPQPAQSPWAPLPPVEKVSPIQINPPAQPPQQSRFAQRDAHGFDALPALSSSAAKEIAADDFSRTWREERGTKELFNSHSGRYEPVNETRRGSIRDRESAYNRQPVIQRRPDGSGPAEPSAAFQTSRSGAEIGPWSRRRTSSNVSGGSGRRMSFGRPQEPPLLGDHQLRRGSHSVTESDGTAPGEVLRPNFGQQRHQPHDIPGPPQHAWGQRQSPAVSNAQPASPYGSIHSQSGAEHANAMGPPAAPAPDPVVVQQQVMKDNIERARQAKQKRDEEEAKAEAEKKARIEKLMAKLEPSPKVEKPASVPTPASEATASKEKPAALSSPPKPPIPTNDSVTQYGMMKVHPSTTVKKHSPPLAAPTDGHVNPVREAHGPSQTRPSDVPSRTISSSLSPAPVTKIEEVGVLKQKAEAGPLRVQKSDGPASRPPHISPNASQETQPTWKPQAAPETFQPWGATGPAQTSRALSSVWGSSHGALGNGTFEPNYHPSLPRHSNQSNNPGPQAGPGPIAPPSKPSPAASHAVPHPSQSLEQQRIFPPHADIRLPPVAPIGAPSPNQAIPQITPPGPIAPPTRNMAATQSRAAFGVSDWTNLAGNAGRHDAELIAKRQEKMSNQHGFAPQLEETYKKTVPGGRAGERRVVKTEQYVYDKDNLSAPAVQVHVEAARERSDYPPPISGPPPVNQYMGTQGISQQQGAVQHPQQAQPGKSSRFFPTTSGTKNAPAVNGVFAESDSDSPPPPETCTANHPAWDGESDHPKVNLPVPKAVVKLPPVPQPSASAVVMPPRPPPMSRVGSQPIVTSTAWQDRFNGLFGKVSAAQPAQTSPNAPAAVVSSVSKASFDSTTQRPLATVSLPSQSESKKNFRRAIFATDGSKDIVSKHSAEEELLEDREFGSLPAVRMSKPDYVNKDNPNFPMAMNGRFALSVKPTTVEEFAVPQEQNLAGYVLHILIPNSKRAASTKFLAKNPKARKNSGFNANKKKNFNGRVDGGSFNQGNSSHSGPRPRKPSNNQHSQGTAPAGSPRTNSQRNSWNTEGNNRTTSTPNNPWSGKRAGAAAVH